MQVILQSFYGLAPLASKPINYHTLLQPERNEEIRRRYAAGETGSSLALLQRSGVPIGEQPSNSDS